MSASVSYGALTLSRHCSLNSRLMSEDPAPPDLSINTPRSAQH